MQRHHLWIVIRRSEVPGEWSAHCLDLDVVSQGRSALHAIDMVTEAACMVIDHDLTRGGGVTIRPAPEEFWAEMYEAITDPATKIVPRADLDKFDPEGGLLIGQIVLVVSDTPRSQRRPSQPSCPPWELPAAWARPSPAAHA